MFVHIIIIVVNIKFGRKIIAFPFLPVHHILLMFVSISLMSPNEEKGNVRIGGELRLPTVDRTSSVFPIVHDSAFQS